MEAVIEGLVREAVQPVKEEVSTLRKELEKERRLRKELEERVSHFDLLLGKEGLGEESIKEVVMKEAQNYAEKLKHGLGDTGGRAAACQEMTEQDRRKENVIVRGIKESDSKTGEDRRKEDLEQAACLFKQMGVDICTSSIKSVRRLGAFSEERRFRPLLVRVGVKNREKLEQNRAKLKELNQTTGSKFRVDPDLTQAQQDAYNNMWKEAEARSKNGERWVVWGPKEKPWLKKWQQNKEE